MKSINHEILTTLFDGIASPATPLTKPFGRINERTFSAAAIELSRKLFENESLNGTSEIQLSIVNTKLFVSAIYIIHCFASRALQ